jgi:hypothetical protein
MQKSDTFKFSNLGLAWSGHLLADLLRKQLASGTLKESCSSFAYSNRGSTSGSRCDGQCLVCSISGAICEHNLFIPWVDMWSSVSVHFMGLAVIVSVLPAHSMVQQIVSVLACSLYGTADDRQCSLWFCITHYPWCPFNAETHLLLQI